jgi:hypothetical protein
MSHLELQGRVDALRDDALCLARELSRHAALPGMGYREMLAAEQMQSVANSLGNVQRSVSTLTPDRVSQAA